MNDNNDRYTFWNLINEYEIEIPIIQRDYAQGRQQEKIDDIRLNFLESLYLAIKNNKALDLDFIYGSVKGTKFIPLDGQQRLTTLFLLHWYLAKKHNKLEDVKELLGKFSYNTRVSSREFCYSLITEADNLSISDDNLKKLSDDIIESSWFFNSWKKDPTVKSMLVMIDSIQNHFVDTDGFIELLLSGAAPVTFKFIKLDRFGLEDSLYIKMNARGKALTDFENFKAKCQQLLQAREDNIEIKCGFTSNFINSIDCDWTDLFWNYRDESNHTFDIQMMNYFRAIIINSYADSMDLDVINKNMGYLMGQSGHFSFLRYNELGCFTNSVFEEIMLSLDAFKNGHLKIKHHLSNIHVLNEDELFEKMISINNNQTRTTYYDRVMFFAVTQYFKMHSSNIETNKIDEWIRVIRNLAANTIDNSNVEFSRSIKSISNLLKYSDNILNFLINHENSVGRFSGEQVEEERIKARLMLRSLKWSQIITRAENHGYFNGQIGFLLRFSGISEAYDKDQELKWNADEDNYFYYQFENYFTKLGQIFNEKGLNVDRDLWRRALLTKGDYLLESNRNKSFLVDLHRDVSWKRLMRDKGDKLGYFKALVDDVDINDIEESLKKVINECSVSDWRIHFIKNPEILRACKVSRFIRKTSDNSILLLGSTTTAGYCKEYYSYALYLDLKKLRGNITYYETRGADNEKWFEFNSDQGLVKVTYDYYDKGWKYVVVVGSNKSTFVLDSDVINYLRVQNII